MGGDGETSRVAPLRQLKQACASLRDILKEMESLHAAGKIDKAQLKAQRWQAVVLLSSLKACIRDTFLAGDEWKTRVQEQKDVVESHQLKLQNLLYEKDHLVREIRRCRGFSTKEMDRIEFASGPIPVAVDAEVHRQHLDQLTQELETRKRMMTQVKEIKAKIEVVEAATLRKQAFLDGLREELDRIDDSTGGLQKFMHKPVSATLRLQQEASAQLPAPLYTLFCELEAYQTASGCTKQMQLSIVDAKHLKGASLRIKKRDFPAALLSGGRVRGSDQDESSAPPLSKRLKGPSRSPSVSNGGIASKAPSRSPSMGRARAVESGEIADATDGATGEEGIVVEKPVSSLIIKEMSEVKITNNDDDDALLEDEAVDSENKDVWRCADKAVLLKLSLAVDDDVKGTETKEYSIIFQYFPTAQIVTAEVTAPTTLGKHILTNLFPGDDGLQLAHHATAYKYAHNESNKEVAFPADKTECRPYFWAQWICGLHPLKRDSHEAVSQRRPEPSVRNVMQQLIKRLTAATQLKSHLAGLAKGAQHALVHPAFTRHFPAEIKTKLSDWKETSTPSRDVLALFDQSSVSAGYQYFRVAFKSDKVQVEAWIQITPEYPEGAPQFRLRHATSSAISDSAAVEDNALKEIEIEVNTFYDELVSSECAQYLLAHQLRKVQQCVDVLSAGSVDNLPRCFGRERRGKDRRPALVIDPVTKDVRHR